MSEERKEKGGGMDKRLKGDGSVRRVLVTMPAALHRRVKAAAVASDRTLDEVVVGMLAKASGGSGRPSAITGGGTRPEPSTHSICKEISPKGG